MDSTDTARRVFLASNEVPGLMLGALLGESVAFRRILGARRAGRIGLALALVGLALAAPSLPTVPLLVVLHLLLALFVVVAVSGPVTLSLIEELRLSLWTVAPLLVLFAVLRLIWPASWLPAVAAVVVAHLLVWRGLQAQIDERAD
jgi:hypothetical protein